MTYKTAGGAGPAPPHFPNRTFCQSRRASVRSSAEIGASGTTLLQITGDHLNDLQILGALCTPCLSLSPTQRLVAINLHRLKTKLNARRKSIAVDPPIRSTSPNPSTRWLAPNPAIPLKLLRFFLFVRLHASDLEPFDRRQERLLKFLEICRR